jgi:hypothetical protein
LRAGWPRGDNSNQGNQNTGQQFFEPGAAHL